ncbi:LLM class F420-dependent oxidoreductase [Streptomyces thinghirensis]|uniref:LLM class F420-dependent oxidoreductase n=1 Tax=Streptomyces thinghirensis TaxID=551547 RepID=A0ABP9T7Y4_9ACTN
MKLGLNLGYSGARLDLPVEAVVVAEKIGFDSVWTAEAYGSDAITPLAYLAAKTERIRLGTGVMQLAARSPAMCAMQAQSVDALAGGNRMIAGLGVSGPQIVEGWYGQPWGKPYHRLRDYIQIMQKIFARAEPVTHEGREISLPYTGEGSTGLGKPLKSILHTDPSLPIWLGALGTANVRLAAELCQGLFTLHFVPGAFAALARPIEEGFRRAGQSKGWNDFEVNAGVTVKVTDDIEGVLTGLKPQIALYVGGMGAREVNFHKEQMVLAGYGDAAQKIQDLYLAGRKDEAIAAVPDDYVDARVLVGPPGRIRERYAAWAESGVTGLTLETRDPRVMELMAELADETPAIGPTAALLKLDKG